MKGEVMGAIPIIGSIKSKNYPLWMLCIESSTVNAHFNKPIKNRPPSRVTGFFDAYSFKRAQELLVA